MTSPKPNSILSPQWVFEFLDERLVPIKKFQRCEGWDGRKAPGISASLEAGLISNKIMVCLDRVCFVGEVRKLLFGIAVLCRRKKLKLENVSFCARLYWQRQIINNKIRNKAILTFSPAEEKAK